MENDTFLQEVIRSGACQSHLDRMEQDAASDSPTSLAAKVAAIVELSVNIGKLCVTYHSGLKNAGDDIARIQKEIDLSTITLQQVKRLLDGQNKAKVNVSQNFCDGIEYSNKQFKMLESKLDVGKDKEKRFFHAPKWPFESEKIDNILRNLKRNRNLISFALQVDQIALALDTHQEIVLGKLFPVKGAAFDSHDEEHNSRCYPGTRADLLAQIERWADDPDGECIFWLNGMAGTGKSTISRTVAHTCADKGQLGASFFFKKGDIDRGRADIFITTVTAQLVYKLPSVARHVLDAIKADPFITQKSMRYQFQELIINPLRKLAGDLKRPSILVVVDALDECDREYDVMLLISLLSKAKDLTSVRLRFFVTSRPDLHLRVGFKKIEDKYQDLVLHEIPAPIIEHDISTFFHYELARIRNDYNVSVAKDRHLPEGWPGKEELQSLVYMAMPLFIFAATACRFIDDRRCGSPDKQLRKLLTYQAGSHASKLATTYRPVLDKLLAGLDNLERQEVLREFREVVGSIAVLSNPLSTACLSHLLGIPKEGIDSQLDFLHSVLSIPSNPAAPVKLFHLSFRDFLVDPDNRDENPFWVDEKKIHEKLARRCLELLSEKDILKRDICNLRMPGARRTGLSKQVVDDCLPPQVQYACLYWVHHLKEAKGMIRDEDRVHKFLKSHFLHWVEALSLMGGTSETINMINDLLTMADTDALAFVRDAKRFFLCYRSVIDSSPLQLYTSALVFAPKQSIVRQTFKHYIPKWISPLPNVDSNWNAVLQTLEGHTDSVRSVVFSNDGKLIASGSWDKTVKVWDTASGDEVRTLEGHTSGVTSVVFSNDGKLIASGSLDRTVKVWDTASGDEAKSFATARVIGHLSFSKDDSFLITDIGRYRIGSGEKKIHTNAGGTGDGQETEASGDKDTPIGFGIKRDGTWVMENGPDGCNVLWLPPDYRPGTSAVSILPSGSTISIGSPSGRMFIMGFPKVA